MNARADALADALVIFGVTGDLAYKKIIPAVYRLHQRGRLRGPVFGVARPDWSIEELRERFAQSLREHAAETDPAAIAPFIAQLRYVAGDYQDPETFRRLRDALGYDLDDNVVGNELAAIHDGLELQAQRVPGFDGGAQHVAGG